MDEQILEIDERFLPDWVAYGIDQLAAHLESHARFDAYCQTRDQAEARQAA